MLQRDDHVDAARLTDALAAGVGADQLLLLDATDLAERIFGTHLPANVMLLGAASQLGALPVAPDAIEDAITATGPAATTNVEAFRWGRWLVADRDAVDRALEGAGGGPTARGQSGIWDPSDRATATARRLVAARRLPAEQEPLLVRRAAQVIDYQDVRRAERWLDLVDRAAATDDADHGWALTEAVAEGWFKVLTYKDEYEVARLHLRLDLDGMADELGIEGGYRVQYHLHPPSLRRLGMDRKIAVSGRFGKAAFRGLAAMRKVRGTALDPFGYNRHRREERELIEEYEQLVRGALDGLQADTYDDAVALARSVQTVKGYEDIKTEALARWRADVASAG
jgi:indolepyruvate ferredoxin oxidoreductase